MERARAMSTAGIHNKAAYPARRHWFIGGSLTVLQVSMVVVIASMLFATWGTAATISVDAVLFALLLLAVNCVFAISPVAIGMLVAVSLFRLRGLTSAPLYACDGALIGIGWLLILWNGAPRTLLISAHAVIARGAAVGLLAGLFLWVYLWRPSKARRSHALTLASIF